MNFDYDVVIVGAGPVGSTISYYLAQNGLNVAVVEKKKQIGYPLQCAGILSKHIFENNELPEEVILNSVKGAFLHTKNHILNVEKQENVAYVIDRSGYDQYLLNRAIENGVKLINHKVIDVNAEKGITYFSNNEFITSKIIVACDGYNSKISSIIGNAQQNFPASQMLVSIDGEFMNSFRKSNKTLDDYVDTYLFEYILPGFLWIIPLKNNQYRVGLFSNHSHKQQNEFLINFLNENFNYEIIEKYKGFIPIYNNKNKLVKNRVLLIGDAASQVKPTSGGGLLIAFDSCKIASKYITEAIKKDNIKILSGYQEEFIKKYSKEFNYQFKVQNTLNLLNDKDLDYLFEKLRENECEKIISEYGDMDNQSKLVKEFIKRGLIFKIIPTFLFKKVANIFGFR
ncbi:NAD(P)/FAD-dependent oxidoreductase [Methanobrevibacter sp.]|uniref:geranylgeranyl reductase family protein n=1 Tax=Methanobrevibacter sp. TaxID=66852 RepID=UPI0025DBDF4F|nr:NAD(P)/FAD-dependent oxidoreductase [Methanobrevibacter sp.]MBR4448079.1 NAD(P)/FAD-dependent oxidoreductase [Methanobrevibacter sp.]